MKDKLSLFEYCKPDTEEEGSFHCMGSFYSGDVVRSALEFYDSHQDKIKKLELYLDGVCTVFEDVNHTVVALCAVSLCLSDSGLVDKILEGYRLEGGFL